LQNSHIELAYLLLSNFLIRYT